MPSIQIPWSLSWEVPMLRSRGTTPGSASLPRIPGHSQEMDLESTCQATYPFPEAAGRAHPPPLSVRGARQLGHVSFSRPILSNRLGCKVPEEGLDLASKLRALPRQLMSSTQKSRRLPADTHCQPRLVSS